MTDSLDLPRGFYHLHLPETDSTMLCLLRPDLSARSEAFVLATTDFQTAGHGQRGTVWEAAAGRNLLFSFAFHPTFVSAGGQFRLSEALALAVAESLDGLPVEVSVKWPNDIYAGNRKICGMLLEHDLRGTHIYNTRAGVGLNVNQRRFEGDAPNPVSMWQLLGRDTERGPLLSAILHRFCAYYSLPASTAARGCTRSAMPTAVSAPASMPSAPTAASFCATKRGASARMRSRK